MVYDPQNIFARILRGEIPCTKVYEDEVAFAFHDIAPSAPVHVLVIPKGEYTSFDDFSSRASAEFMRAFYATVRHVAQQLGLQENGYRIITNTGPDASQTVFHYHVHILGGKPLGQLLAD